jgi:hypothetical protein
MDRSSAAAFAVERDRVVTKVIRIAFFLALNKRASD